jgi:hypothetical protein
MTLTYVLTASGTASGSFRVAGRVHPQVEIRFLYAGQYRRETPCPESLGGSVRDLIIANFDHRARQPKRPRVALERVVDAVRRAVWLVHADIDACKRLQSADQRQRQTSVVVVNDADLPWARDILVDRSEAVNRHDPAFAPISASLCHNRLKRVVKRPMRELDPRFAFLVRQPEISGDGGPFAGFRDKIRSVEWTVAIDQQPRDAGFNQCPVERGGQRARHRQRTWIPGDMTDPIAPGQSERSKVGRNVVRRVLAHDDIGSRAMPVRDPHRIMWTEVR